ncbi:MAG: NAD(P)H-hydrate dehydratase [Actinomycetota bacterium]|nr:NAD(P)H-hydrate dehydratase [Actinomycetota bacterium]
MLLAKADRMRAIEEEAVANQGITLYQLMERAGAAVAEEAGAMLPAGGRVIIFCGKGNNGGDGFVAARLLADKKKYDVEVIMLTGTGEATGAAAGAYREIAHAASITKTPFNSRKHPKSPDLVIDAILGFGLRGTVRGTAAQAIKAINSYNAPVLSVDIPSGVDADTGQVEGDAVKADRTITFTCPKAGMAIYPGLDHVGTMRIADIGIAKETIAKHANVCLGSRAVARLLLPTRRTDAHKGDCGRVLVLAGSVGMTGAAAMSSLAALRIGAGLVTLGIPESLNDILETKLTEVITKPLPETPGRTIRAKAADQIMEMIPATDAVLIGPGLSTHPGTVTLARQLVTAVPAPMVIDADGLNALVGKTDLLAKRPGPTIMTPHPGELGRLLGISTEAVQSDRLTAAAKAADAWQATVILKGARTIIAGGGCLHINPTGNPGMATAGTGDVLAGMVAGLVAQGLPPYPASVLAVYLHGRAGDLAARKTTELALIATDLLDYLPTAIRELKKKGGP